MRKKETEKQGAITLEVIARLIHALDKGMNGRIDGLEGEMNRRFDVVDKRFNEVDKRFAKVDSRFTKVDKRLNEMSKQSGDECDRICHWTEKNIETVDARLDKIEEHLPWFALNKS